MSNQSQSPTRVTGVRNAPDLMITRSQLLFVDSEDLSASTYGVGDPIHLLKKVTPIKGGDNQAEQA
jgi:hypothetical protein